MRIVFFFLVSFLLLFSTSCSLDNGRELRGNWKQIQGRGKGRIVEIQKIKSEEGKALIGKCKEECVWTGFKILQEKKHEYLVYQLVGKGKARLKNNGKSLQEPFLLHLSGNRLELESIDDGRVLEVYLRIENT